MTTMGTINIILVVAVIFAIAMSRSPEALIGIVAIASLIVYGMGRYWRNPAN
jgi:hypothetical protein